MRTLTTFCLALFTAPLFAQNWYLPDNIATSGNCNVIPFGQNAGGPFYNSKYQTRVLAADLGNLPGIVSGLAFAACNSGRAHYDQLEIVIDHIPPAQPLVTTFAQNLTPAAQTVLSATHYSWIVPGSLWTEVGLQDFFVYNGTDDLVVQITSTNGIAPVQGFRSGSRQRIYWIGSAGPAPASGTAGSAALKMEVSMLTAHTSLHGDGCPGSNGTPVLTCTGLPQIGTSFSTDLNGGVPNGVAVLLAGLTNATPLPLELGFLGAPGCHAYTDILASAAILLDGSGVGSFTFPVPATVGAGFRFYAQYACLDLPANAFGMTTSNYGRILVGL